VKWELDPIISSPAAWERDPVVRPSPVPAGGLAVVLGPGLPVPEFLKPLGNPHSAGLYPLGRKFTVGDEGHRRVLDLFSGIEQRRTSHRVLKVDIDADRVYFDNNLVVDLMGNLIQAGPIQWVTPKQAVPAELQVGKKWRAAYQVLRGGVRQTPSTMDYVISVREKVVVPAGTFEAFRIDGDGTSEGHHLKESLWVLPYVNFLVRWDRLVRHGQHSNPLAAERHELVSLRQAAIEWT
jgi:hypothetical protein